MVDKLTTEDRLTALLVLCMLIFLVYAVSTVYGVTEAGQSSTQSKRELDRKLLVFDEAVRDQIYTSAYRDSAASIYGAFSVSSRQRVRWIQLVRDIESKAGIGLLGFDISARQDMSRKGGGDDARQLLVGYESLSIELAIEHEGLLVGLMQWVEVNAPSQFEITQLSLNAATPDKKIQMNLQLRWYLLDTKGENNA